MHQRDNQNPIKSSLLTVHALICSTIQFSDWTVGGYEATYVKQFGVLSRNNLLRIHQIMAIWSLKWFSWLKIGLKYKLDSFRAKWVKILPNIQDCKQTAVFRLAELRSAQFFAEWLDRPRVTRSQTTDSVHENGGLSSQLELSYGHRQTMQLKYATMGRASQIVAWYFNWICFPSCGRKLVLKGQNMV